MLTKKMSKLNRSVGMPCNLQNIVILFRSYRDVIYDKAYDNSFNEKQKSIQCNTAALVVIGGMKKMSPENIYLE